MASTMRSQEPPRGDIGRLEHTRIGVITTVAIEALNMNKTYIPSHRVQIPSTLPRQE